MVLTQGTQGDAKEGETGQKKTNKASQLPIAASSPVHLVECYNEGRLFLLEQVDGLYRLRLEALRDVHHQDGNVAEGGATRAEVAERLVTWGIDNQQAGELDRIQIELKGGRGNGK